MIEKMTKDLNKLSESQRPSISVEKDLLAFLSASDSTPVNDQEIDINLLLKERGKDFKCKIILLGDGSVGKTAIQNRYVHKQFSDDYYATIGVDLATKDQQVGSYNIKFQIWDIAGQPHFHEVRKSYYSFASAGIVVCDVTKPDTIDNINNWIVELWKHNGKGPIPLVLVGNKIDLQDTEINSLTNQLLSDFVAEINSKTIRTSGFKNSYIPASAKTGVNIKKIFRQIGIHIIAHDNFIERLKQQKNNE
jgi:small GTP-binding protein